MKNPKQNVKLLAYWIASAVLTVACASCVRAQPKASDKRQPAAPALTVENLGAPVRGARHEGNFLVPKPGRGGWYYITSYGARLKSPFQVYIADLDTRKVVRKQFPELTDWLGVGMIGNDGMAYLTPYGRVGMFVFNPENGTLEYLPSQINDRIAAYQIKTAPNDGKIYIGTASAKAVVVEFDPRTKRFRDFGVQGPALPSPRYIYTMAIGDDYIYSAAGKNPWFLVATNRATGNQKVLLKDMDYLNVSKDEKGILAQVTLTRGKEKLVEHYELEDGRAIKLDAAPQLSTEDRASQRRRREREAASKPQLVTDAARPNTKGEAEVWFQLPRQEKWQSVRLTDILTEAFGIENVGVISGDRILGTSSAYQDAFIYDAKKNKFEIVGKMPISKANIVVSDGLIYLLGYPGTQVYEYDPAREWTISTSTPDEEEPAAENVESNPRRVAMLDKLIETHYVRGAAIGADNTLYFCGHAERLHVGGGIGWWDPETEIADGLREPFRVQDCDGLAAAQAGKTIIYSSRPVVDPRGKTPTPKDAKLFMFDTESKSITGEVAPLPNLKTCGRITAVGNKVYGVAQAGDKHTFYVVDLTTKRTIHMQAQSDRLNSNLIPGPDGNIYGVIGKTLMRINPQTYAMQSLGIIESGGGEMAFLGADLYLAGEANLRRIRKVATPVAPTNNKLSTETNFQSK